MDEVSFTFTYCLLKNGLLVSRLLYSIRTFGRNKLICDGSGDASTTCKEKTMTIRWKRLCNLFCFMGMILLHIYGEHKFVSGFQISGELND